MEVLARLANLPGALPGACAQGLIWGIMAIGVYLTYRILDVADLTVDNSFGTGGAVCVMALLTGQNVWTALILAFIAGLACGLVTGLLHTFMGIPAILAGILTQLALYSVNLKIMGKSNQSINVDKYDLLISLRWVKEFALHNPVIMVILISAVLIGLLYWFFGTELGCAIRATGSNPNMSRAQGINTNFNVVLGLMVSNGLVALSGALLSQYQGFADVSMGRGAIVIGLAAVIIGETIFGRIFHNFALKLVSVSIGAVVYYIVLQLVLTLGFDANLLKLLSAAVVAIFLAVPYWKGKYFTKPAAKKAQKTRRTSAAPRPRRRNSPMLDIQNISKTFNPGTVNEKTALNGLSLRQRKDGPERPVPPPERRRFRHRHRRQRRWQIHHAERGGRRLAGGRGQDFDRRRRRHPPERVPARQVHRPGLSGPHDRHRRHHADRGKSGPGGPPRQAPHPAHWHHPQRAGGIQRAAQDPGPGAGKPPHRPSGPAVGRPAPGADFADGHHEPAQAAAAGRAHRRPRPQDC